METSEVEEGTYLDTGIVSDIEEEEGEMKMIVESTRIGEGREEGKGKEGEGRGEEMKGREREGLGRRPDDTQRVLQPALCTKLVHSVSQIFLASSSGCSSASKFSD